MFLYLLIIISFVCNNKQTFRCLIKTISPQTFFINLTFDNNRKITDFSGRLTQLEVDYLDFRDDHPKIITKIDDKNSIIKDSYFIKTNYDLYSILIKNRNKTNSIKTKSRRISFLRVQIGIPIPINVQMTLSPQERTTHETYLHANNDYIDFTHYADFRLYMNYLLQLSYKINRYSITDIRIEDSHYELVMCKDTTETKLENNKEKELIGVGELFRLLDNKHRLYTKDNKMYNHYDRLYENSYIVNNNKKLGAVLFLNRIKFSDMTTVIMNDNKSRTIQILPSFDDDFAITFLFIANDAYCLNPERNYNKRFKLLMEINHSLVAKYELKKVDKKGTKIRKYK